MKNTPSTPQRVSAGSRLALIASCGEVLFHTHDLANYWNIHNSNSLHKTISRYIQSGWLYRVQKGLYSIRPVQELNPYLLGIKALHRPSYVSCESILFNSGIINQPPNEITLISSISTKFTLGGHRFRSRKLNEKYLYNNEGINIVNGVRTASVYRAIADTLYFNQHKYFDSIESSTINWDDVLNTAHTIGYNIGISRNDGLTKSQRRNS